MSTDGRIRLVPPAPPPALSIDDARDAAKAAYAEARVGQADLVAHLYLTKMLAAPGVVTYRRLKGMRHEAQAQVNRARDVLGALERAIESMESATEDGGSA